MRNVENVDAYLAVDSSDYPMDFQALECQQDTDVSYVDPSVHEDET